MIVPIIFIFAIGGMATMCTAITGAKARRHLRERQVASAPTAPVVAARRAKDSVAATAGAQITACPERLPDMAGWRRMSAEGSPIEIPVPPDFEVVPQTGSADVNPPFLVLRAVNGDELRLTRTTGPIHGSDIRDYESTSSCRITFGDLFADIETVRDTWRGGEHRAVLATYWILNRIFITAHGTTETAEHQRQLIAAIHGARLRQ